MSETKKLGKLFVEELEKRVTPASTQALIHANTAAFIHASPNSGLGGVVTTFALGEEDGGNIGGGGTLTI